MPFLGYQLCICPCDFNASLQQCVSQCENLCCPNSAMQSPVPCHFCGAWWCKSALVMCNVSDWMCLAVPGNTPPLGQSWWPCPCGTGTTGRWCWCESTRQSECQYLVMTYWCLCMCLAIRWGLLGTHVSSGKPYDSRNEWTSYRDDMSTDVPPLPHACSTLTNVWGIYVHVRILYNIIHVGISMQILSHAMTQNVLILPYWLLHCSLLYVDLHHKSNAYQLVVLACVVISISW